MNHADIVNMPYTLITQTEATTGAQVRVGDVNAPTSQQRNSLQSRALNVYRLLLGGERGIKIMQHVQRCKILC
jgi:hypothetical protein